MEQSWGRGRRSIQTALIVVALFVAGSVVQAGLLLSGLPGPQILVFGAYLVGQVFGFELGREDAVIASCFLGGVLVALTLPLARLWVLVSK